MKRDRTAGREQYIKRNSERLSEGEDEQGRGRE